MAGGAGGEGCVPWFAPAVLIALLLAVGCGSKGRSPEPMKVVDQPRTIRLGIIGAPLVVDGDGLVHVAYRHDRLQVVRRDLASGDARTLLRRTVEPSSVDAIAARAGRVAVETSAPLGHRVAYRILEASHGRVRVLGRASDNAECGGKVSVHNVTRASEVLVSEVRGVRRRGDQRPR